MNMQAEDGSPRRSKQGLRDDELMAYPPVLADVSGHYATVMEHGRHSRSRQIARANREASENVHRFCP